MPATSFPGGRGTSGEPIPRTGSIETGAPDLDPRGIFRSGKGPDTRSLQPGLGCDVDRGGLRLRPVSAAALQHHPDPASLPGGLLNNKETSR